MQFFLYKNIKREERLFINNTGLCTGVIHRIKFETCPLHVTEEKNYSVFFKCLVNGGDNPDRPKVAKFLVG